MTDPSGLPFPFVRTAEHPDDAVALPLPPDLLPSTQPFACPDLGASTPVAPPSLPASPT